MKTQHQPLSPSIVTISDFSLKPRHSLPDLRKRGVQEEKSLEFNLSCHDESNDFTKSTETYTLVPNQGKSSLPPVKSSDRSGERPSKALIPREFFIPVAGSSTFEADPRYLEMPSQFENESEVHGITGSLSKLSLSLHEDSFQSMDTLSSTFIFKPYRGKSLTRNNSSSKSPHRIAIEDGRSDFEHSSSGVRSPSKRNAQSNNAEFNQLNAQPGSSSSKEVDPLSYQVHNRILGWKLTSVQRRKDLIDVLEAIHNPDDPRLQLQSRRFKKTLQSNFASTPSESIDPQVQERLSRRRGESIERFLSRSLQKNESLLFLGSGKRTSKQVKQRNRPKDRLHSKDISTVDDEFQRVVSHAFGDNNNKNDEIEEEDLRNQSRGSNYFPINIHKRRDRMDILESVRHRKDL